MQKIHILLCGALLSLVLSGCMSVKMPEHMVSDTVDAGKKAYDSISGKSKEAPGIEFSYTAIFDESTSVKEATNQCYDRVSQHALNEMKDTNLNISRVSDSVKKLKNVYGVECRIRAVPVTAKAQENTTPAKS